MEAKHTFRATDLTHRCVYMYVWCMSPPYLVEPKVIRLKKTLEFWEQLVIVEAVDGLHITCAVIQVACHLM